MGAAFGGVKFVSAAACYNVLAVFNVIIQHIRKPEKLWLSVRNGNHNNAYGFLQIGVFKQSIQHFLRIEILFDFYNGANACSVGLVPYITDAGEYRFAFLLNERKHLLKRGSLIDLIRKLCYYYICFSVFERFKMRFCAIDELSPARFICRANFRCVQTISSDGKIRTGQYLHKVIKADFRVFNFRDHGIYRFRRVVRRNGSRQSDRNAV